MAKSSSPPANYPKLDGSISSLHAPQISRAAPINWAIANGETQTGITTMRIGAGMDTGGMLCRGN